MRQALHFVIASLVVCVALASLARTEEEARKAEVGKAKPTWSNLPGTDDEKHSLADLKKSEVIVIAVTCNHCPLAIEYYDRMKDFATKFCGTDGKVAMVAISVSELETDRLPRMKEMAERKRFNFAYLYDESQESAKSLGATNTPQFFILDKNRVLVYRGAWDDNFNSTKVTKQYVEESVAALLAGKKPEVAETKAPGCIVTY